MTTQYYLPPTQLPPQPPNHKVRNRIGIVLAFVLAGVILVGVPLAGYQALGSVIGKDTPTLPTILPPTKFTVTGTMTVRPDDILTTATDGGSCTTDPGHNDIEEGAQVEVQNGKGE